MHEWTVCLDVSWQFFQFQFVYKTNRQILFLCDRSIFLLWESISEICNSASAAANFASLCFVMGLKMFDTSSGLFRHFYTILASVQTCIHDNIIDTDIHWQSSELSSMKDPYHCLWQSSVAIKLPESSVKNSSSQLR